MGSYTTTSSEAFNWPTASLMNLSNVLYTAANHTDKFNHNVVINRVINTDANNKLIMLPGRNVKGDNLLPL